MDYGGASVKWEPRSRLRRWPCAIVDAAPGVTKIRKSISRVAYEIIAHLRKFLVVHQTSSDASRQRQSTSVHIPLNRRHLCVTYTIKKVLDTARR
jgi:hypothetical protein